MKPWLLRFHRLDEERLRDLLDLIAQQVDVDHRGSEILVPQDFTHRFHVNALSEHQRGCGMSQVMEPNAPPAPSFHIPFKAVCEGIVVKGPSRYALEDRSIPTNLIELNHGLKFFPKLLWARNMATLIFVRAESALEREEILFHRVKLPTNKEGIPRLIGAKRQVVGFEPSDFPGPHARIDGDQVGEIVFSCLGATLVA